MVAIGHIGFSVIFILGVIVGRPAVDDLFQRQAALATVGQLAASGVSRSALRARLRREWCFVLPRLVSGTRRPLDDQQRLAGALLFAGEGTGSRV